MASTTTAVALQHERDALTLDCDPGPSFADVVYLLTTPPPDADPKQAWSLSSRLPRYAALFAYSLVHPSAFALWLNDTLGISETIRDATYPEVRREWADAAKAHIGYALSVARPFLFAPRGPEARARAAGVRPIPVYGPVKDGMVRIKWYPNLEATKRWPAGMGKLWVDVPLDDDSSVDLGVVMELWGMQNCHVIDANRPRPQLWRRPVERLSGLAISVLLADGHKVIGVVERPSEHLQVAREYRAYAKNRVRLLLTSLSRSLWQTLTTLATVACNLAVYSPRLLWFFLWCSPYILFHALEIVFLVIFAIGTLAVYDLEELGYTAQDCLAPYVCGFFRAAREWLVAGLEAAFLTDEEIRRVMKQRAETPDVSEE